MPPPRSPLAELLAALNEVMASFRSRWYLFGAQAAILHGAARLTADVDITVDLGDRPTRELVDALTRGGFALRVHDMEGFVERTRVVPLLHSATRMPLDVVLAGPGMEDLFFEGVETFEVEGTRIPVASAADVVVMKVLSGRPKDIEDVVAIVAAHISDLDYARVDRGLALLEGALDQSDLRPAFEQARRRALASAKR